MALFLQSVLLGMKIGCTNGEGFTALDRLSVIGNGWDIFVTSALMTMLPLNRYEIEDTILDDEAKPSPKDYPNGVLKLKSELSDEEFMKVFDKFSSSDQVEIVEILKRSLEPSNPIFKCTSVVLDSGSSRHIDNRAKEVDSEDRACLTGFDNKQAWTEGRGFIPGEVADASGARREGRHPTLSPREICNRVYSCLLQVMGLDYP